VYPGKELMELNFSKKIMNQKFALRTGTTKQDSFCKQRYVASTIIFYSHRPKLLYIAKVMYLGKK
jgi:hypothetical protein